MTENNRIRMVSEDGSLELEILEETTVAGVHYILVTDAPEGEDGECYVMKDVSGPYDEEADYEFAGEEESDTIMDVFSKLLEGEGITIEK